MVAVNGETQRTHFDQIQRRYEAHYDDDCSQRYRDRFFHEPMFRGVELAGKTVLEAMCGSGQTTRHLLSRGAVVTGIDISEESIRSFRRRWPSCGAIRASVLDSKLESESFDVIAVVGGLHHLQPRPDAAVAEFQRLLKPGGYFCFVEPHRSSIPDRMRRLWYRHDSLFAENEESIDLEDLRLRFSGGFDFVREQYLGNIAYLLVLNSMVFRMPLSMKPVYAPALLRLESMIAPIQGRRFSCFVVGQWRRK